MLGPAHERDFGPFRDLRHSQNLATPIAVLDNLDLSTANRGQRCEPLDERLSFKSIVTRSLVWASTLGKTLGKKLKIMLSIDEAVLRDVDAAADAAGITRAAYIAAAISERLQPAAPQKASPQTNTVPEQKPTSSFRSILDDLVPTNQAEFAEKEKPRTGKFDSLFVPTVQGRK
jgi:hypothetical protein